MPKNTPRQPTANPVKDEGASKGRARQAADQGRFRAGTDNRPDYADRYEDFDHAEGPTAHPAQHGGITRESERRADDSSRAGDLGADESRAQPQDPTESTSQADAGRTRSGGRGKQRRKARNGERRRGR